MIGAIIGDIVGSRFEFQPIKTKDFFLFTPDSDYTDDSLMTIAVGMALDEAIERGKG
ncbi:ADP-ribosylglycohydrolase family protein [Kallipyga massiliensis]|uniref:ADP-ribosylglycohydrolase family protein n=1 Tax=Kallipyga massiliensis TaxID=1472764 RepID=UPI0004B9EEAE|nr:ADP-ribosylglycohydrolase family protein [Kallipyga massiliensis]